MNAPTTPEQRRKRLGCCGITQGCVSLFFGLSMLAIFGTLGVAFLYTEASCAWDGLASRRWAATTGEITEAFVYYQPGGKRNPGGYVYWIEYRYRVQGKDYAAHRLRFASDRELYKDKADATALIAPYPKGQSVQVYYDPNRPGEATLNRESAILWGKILAGLFMLGIAGLFPCLWLFRDKFADKDGKPPQSATDTE